MEGVPGGKERVLGLPQMGHLWYRVALTRQAKPTAMTSNPQPPLDPPTGSLGILDRLLRGGFTDPESLQGSGISIPIKTLVKMALIFGMLYGAMMGLFALFSWETKSDALKQLVSTSIKVPLLYLLTLLVTFPSLYVVSALARTRLSAADTGRLLLVAMAVNLALLASLGPITAFFTVSTDSYPFMILLNVLFFAIAGLVGLAFLRRAIGNLLTANDDDALAPATIGEEDSQATGENPLDAVSHRRTRDSFQASAADRTKRLLGTWCLLFGVVGCQMGWILRPFIGDPELPFQIFRERSSNFFSAVVDALGKLLS